ncbi:MAG TPA: AAA family ATPase [Myxococcota bacterium]|nr:AAA family ATPase [Myxococcota bacterium]
MSGPRLVAIVYTDLVGSTESVARLGPLDGEAWRKRHLAVLREALALHDAREIQAFGDGMLVVCGSASDAVGCAIAMQLRVARANQRRDALAAFSVRIGVSVGEGTEDAEGVHGLVVVEAARLCAAAKGGQILASALVEALCAGRGGHRFSSVGSLELKGLPAPVASVEVLWQSERPGTVPLPAGLAEAARSPFVGRADEREQLGRALHAAAGGERRVGLVAGEPGIGKTRLAAEIARDAVETGALVLYGRCDEELGAPYQPFAEALAHYARASEPEELRSQLLACGIDTARIVPEIGRRLPDLPMPMVDEPGAERFRLFEAVDALLASASQASPVVLVLDDLHWSDKPSLLLLRHLARSSRPAALLVLGTYRETDLARTHPLAELLGDLRREPSVERVRLAGLDAGEVGALLTARAQHEAPEAFVRLVHSETEGNPFFVEELLRHLVETGTLLQENGRWASDRNLTELGIPEGIREVVGRRLSRLSEAANETLRVAAVLGREFDAATLAAAQGLPIAAALESLDEACRSQITAEVAKGRFAFTHALIRQTLYEEIGTTRRVRLHWRIAEELEQRLAGRLEEHIAVLAHHAAEGVLAGDPLKAATWSVRAGARAANLIAREDAIAHYRRALAILDQAGILAPELRYEALTGVGEGSFYLADEKTVRAAFGEATEIARAQGWVEREALAVLGRTSFIGLADDDWLTQIGPVDAALAALGPRATPERSRLLARRSQLLRMRDASTGEAEESAEQALAIARLTGGSIELIHALSAKGFLRIGSPDLGERRRDSEELYRAAEATGDLRFLAAAARFSATIELQSGSRSSFEAAKERLRRLADATRSHPMKVYAFAWDAAVALAEGRFDDAKSLGAQSREAARGMGGFELFYIAIVVGARLEQGRHGQVIADLERFVATAPRFLQAYRAVLATACAEAGRLDAARRALDSLVEGGFSRVIRDWSYLLSLRHLAECCAWLDAREHATAIEHLVAPYRGCLLVAYTGSTIECAADRALGQVLAVQGRLDEAIEHYESALVLEAAFGAPALAARTRYWMARAFLARATAGDVTRARELARDSRAEAKRLGMPLLEGHAATVEEAAR